MPCHIQECQFQVPESQLFLDAQLISGVAMMPESLKYCIFHAPEDSEDSWGKEKEEQFEKGINDFIDRCLSNNELINLSKVIFPEVIDFSGRTFSNISFKDAKFVDSVYFNGTQFQGRADFQGASCFDTAEFSGSVFTGEVNFKGAHLNMGGDFEDTEFEDFTDFGEATLTGATSFFNAKFGMYTSFRDVNFNSTVNFQGVEVNGEIDFQNANFVGSTEFIETQFLGPVNFSVIAGENSNDTFPEIDFKGSFFKEEVVFNNRKFLSSTSFRDCTFNSAPKFHNCELHQDTIFPPEKNFKDIASDGAVRAYGTLKLKMGNVQAHREQGMFYALEQKSLRLATKAFNTSKPFSWLYEKTADYGQSMGKPLACLGGMIGGFFVIYLVIACTYASQTKSCWELVVKTLGFSFKQAFQPFYVLRQPSLEWITDVTGMRIVKTLATIESLSILGLFALFLLCVRWNFKRG